MEPAENQLNAEVEDGDAERGNAARVDRATHRILPMRTLLVALVFAAFPAGGLYYVYGRSNGGESAMAPTSLATTSLAAMEHHTQADQDETSQTRSGTTTESTARTASAGDGPYVTPDREFTTAAQANDGTDNDRILLWCPESHSNDNAHIESNTGDGGAAVTREGQERGPDLSAGHRGSGNGVGRRLPLGVLPRAFELPAGWLSMEFSEMHSIAAAVCADGKLYVPSDATLLYRVSPRAEWAQVELFEGAVSNYFGDHSELMIRYPDSWRNLLDRWVGRFRNFFERMDTEAAAQVEGVMEQASGGGHVRPPNPEGADAAGATSGEGDFRKSSAVGAVARQQAS